MDFRTVKGLTGLTLATGLLIGGNAVASSTLTGFSVGAGVDLYNDIEIESEDVSDGETVKYDFSDNLSSFDLVAGYATVLNNGLYLAGDVRYMVGDGADDSFPGDTAVTLLEKEAFSINSKVGFLPTPDIAVYGILGYGMSEFEGGLSVTTSGVTVSSTQSEDHDGLRYGIGASHSIAENLIISLDAVIQDLSSERYTYTIGGDDFAFDVDGETTTIDLSIAYRF